MNELNSGSAKVRFGMLAALPNFEMRKGPT